MLFDDLLIGGVLDIYHGERCGCVVGEKEESNFFEVEVREFRLKEPEGRSCEDVLRKYLRS